MNQTVRFRVDFACGCSIGPGKVALLEGIGRAGSLRQAARDLGMSYRRAWLLLDQINQSFITAATTATVGGAGGGGAQLTPFGEELIRRYRALERRIGSLSREALAPLAARARSQPQRGQAGHRSSSRRRRLSRTASAGRPD